MGHDKLSERINMLNSTYIIKGGDVGARRLKVLANATWPDSFDFLRRSGLKSGMSLLDVGCGSGEVTLRLAEYLGPTSELVGIDVDQSAIEIARKNASNYSWPPRYEVFDIMKGVSPNKRAYDFVYVRFLLTHLTNPMIALKNIYNSLRTGSKLVVEDIDFRGHFCHPPNREFKSYLSLYKQASLRKGTNPDIGPRLPVLMKESGFKSIDLKVTLPTFTSGPGKEMALLTLRAIREELLVAGLIKKQDLEELISGLENYTKDQESMMSLPRIFHVLGVRT